MSAFVWKAMSRNSVEHCVPVFAIYTPPDMMTFERRIGLCVKDLMVASAGVVKSQTEIAGSQHLGLCV